MRPDSGNSITWKRLEKSRVKVSFICNCCGCCCEAVAIERGKLQHLFFDNRVLWSHRALAAVLGVILKLPPVKQIVASNQIKSRYLENLISKKAN